MLLEPGLPRGAAAVGRPERLLSICFVAPHAWPVFSGDAGLPVVGGAEVQQSILARLFASHGYRVSMICLDYGQPQHAEVHGVVVHKTFKATAGVPALRFLHPRLSSMWRAMREVDADIYYYRSASMWVGFLAEFCRRHGKRAIYAGASDRDFVPGQGGQIRHARDRWLYRRGLALVDRIVAQNELQRATCRATYGRDALVIPSCYALPEKTTAKSRDLVLWVGTQQANKRPELALELARRLPHRRFVMIGGPNRDRQLYEAIRRRAAGIANLEFKGFLPLREVESWFDRARVLVNTSVYEGMPNTFLQAWARGVPTVSTVDVGAPGHRVASSVEELAREVEFLFQNPRMGASCREYFERTHSRAQVLSRYARLFDELAA
jgi:glycosyltransferase involved in cell wall biosynthesis